MTVTVKSDFDLVMSMPDIDKYVGKWVAVVNHKIVAIAETFEDAFVDALNAHPGCEPYLVRVPRKCMMIL